MAGLGVGGSKGTSKNSSTQTTTNPYAVQRYNDAVATLPKTRTALTGDQINGFMSPFKSDVIDATLARNNQNRDMALNGNQDQAIRSGAFGGSGQSVADALTKGQYDLNDQQTIANLNDENYTQAVETAQSENDANNNYPLLIQQLLAQIAQGTTQNSSGSGKGTTTNLSASWAG